MKIALLYKTLTLKAYYFFILIPFLVAAVPLQANAGFFNDLMASVIGTDSQVEATNNSDYGNDNFDDNSQNSQNMPLLESSINPDMKNASDTSIILDNGALLPDDSTGFGSGLENISNGQMTVYEVKEGDTLSEIAAQFDVSTNTIRWENNITGQNIKVGQKLNILPVTGVKHIIKKGDTLDKIAAKYDADVEDIMVFNDVTKTSSLKQGSILYVPNGVIKVEVQKPSTTKKPTSSGSSTPATAGYYLRPTSGPVTSSYGSRRGGFHAGLDIGAARGTPVVAAASGTVVQIVESCVEGRSSCGGRYGNYILIEHENGTSTRYAHLSKVNVNVGQQVSRGQKIGGVGNTGRSTGSHLHFQIEKANGATMRPVF